MHICACTTAYERTLQETKDQQMVGEQSFLNWEKREIKGCNWKNQEAHRQMRSEQKKKEEEGLGGEGVRKRFLFNLEEGNGGQEATVQLGKAQVVVTGPVWSLSISWN